MKVCMIGTGYVGLVSGACFADMGNNVVCVDSNEEKVNLLKQSVIPIYEPGLENIVKSNFEKGRLNFTTDLKEALKGSDVCFIAVGTPSDEDGSADLSHVLKVAEDIGRFIEHDIIVVNKSTVPVGTAKLVTDKVQSELDKRNEIFKFSVVSNPEFLKEGSAVKDFMHPDRVIVGTNDEYGLRVMKELYSPFSVKSDRIIFMKAPEAELTKYAANSMLATKISFMNEIANLCDKLGVDVEAVRKGIGSDTRIGYSFIYPGCGYGGSCFPKDIKALIKKGSENDVNLEILKSVENVNQNQKIVLFKKVKKHLNASVDGKTIGVWGLAFKPGTDDLREAPSFVLIKSLIEAGAKVKAYDPVASDNCRKEWPLEWFESGGLTLMKGAYDTIENSDALVLVTEWKEFRSIDYSALKEKMNSPLVIDGRNQYDPQIMKDNNILYEGIGRSLL